MGKLVRGLWLAFTQFTFPAEQSTRFMIDDMPVSNPGFSFDKSDGVIAAEAPPVRLGAALNSIDQPFCIKRPF